MNFDTPSSRTSRAVRALLAEHGETIEQLADHTGITHSTLKRRMQGLSPFNINEIGAIAEHYGVAYAVVITPPSQRQVA